MGQITSTLIRSNYEYLKDRLYNYEYFDQVSRSKASALIPQQKLSPWEVEERNRPAAVLFGVKSKEHGNLLPEDRLQAVSTVVLVGGRLQEGSLSLKTSTLDVEDRIPSDPKNHRLSDSALQSELRLSPLQEVPAAHKLGLPQDVRGRAKWFAYSYPRQGIKLEVYNRHFANRDWMGLAMEKGVYGVRGLVDLFSDIDHSDALFLLYYQEQYDLKGGTATREEKVAQLKRFWNTDEEPTDAAHGHFKKYPVVDVDSAVGPFAASQYGQFIKDNDNNAYHSED